MRKTRACSRMRWGALLLAVVAVFCQAGEAPLDVYWAGFAYTGEASSRAEAAPHSNAAIDSRGVEPLNATLLGTLERQPPKQLALIPDELAKLDGSTSAIVLAAALDRELVSIEPIGDRYKVLVELALQAIFFDFRERQVVAAYPMTLQYIDLVDSPPSSKELETTVATLLYGDAQTALPQVLAATLAEAGLPGAATCRLQVGGVTLSDQARQKLPDLSRDAALRADLAHELTKVLAANTGIGLLPAATGEAIGGVMATRFADGSVYQLKIPEADYIVQLHLQDLRDGVIGETAAMRQMLFGAFFEITVTEPWSGKVFFQQPLRKGATKVVPATQYAVDTWPASYETLLAGLDSFAGTAANRAGHRDWLSEQKPGGRVLQQQTKALQELIQSCR